MKTKNLLIAFAVIAPASVIFRIFQLIFMIDPTNGFILEKYSGIDTVIKAVFYLIIVAFAVMGRMTSDTDRMYLPRKSMPMAVGYLLMGGALVADTIILLKTIPVDTTVYGNADYIYTIVCAITAGSFIYMAVSSLTGAKIPALMGLVPLICMLFRLILSYTRFNGLVLLSENVLDTLAMCFSMLFMLYFSRVIGSSYPKKSTRWVFGIGLASSFISLLCCLPRWILMLMGKDNLLENSPTPEVFNICLPVFVIIMLLTFYKNRLPEVQKNTVTAPTGATRSRFVSADAEETDNTDESSIDAINDVYNEIISEQNESNNQ